MTPTPFRGVISLFSLLTPALPAVLLAAQAPAPAATAVPPAVTAALARLPFAFEPAAGVAEGASYVSRRGGLSLTVTAAGATVRLAGGKQAADVRFRLVGADAEAPGEGEGLQEGRTHYLVGNQPQAWRCGVPRYEKARFRGVYPGIDAVYYGAEAGLEYDFIIHPGADPGQIRMEVRGAERAEVDAAGDLVLHTAAGVLRQKKPAAYQETDGRRRPVFCAYRLATDGGGGVFRVSFDLGQYDPAAALVIDPVLAYASLMGGAERDDGRAVAVDAQGFVYVAMLVLSNNFPVHQGAFQTSQSGEEIYLAKLDLSRSGLSALVFGTYLGGNGSDTPAGIVIGAGGAVHVAGSTNSADFPTTGSALQPSPLGSRDGFVTTLDPTGSAILYSTYLGGSSSDQANGIGIDGNGRLYACGSTGSTDFPVKNAFQPQHRGSADGFVAKLNTLQSGANSLVYSTYLGGTEFDAATGIAVEAAGRAVVVGFTQSDNYPTTAGGVQLARSASIDAFVTRLNAAGSGLLYSTYLGGNGLDVDPRVALDSSSRIIVSAETDSTDLPVVGGFQGDQGTFDLFLARLNPAAAGAASLQYSTYLGGEGAEGNGAVAVDAAGMVTVVGQTSSTSFPLTPQAIPADPGNSHFLTRMDPNRTGAASLRSSTRLAAAGNSAETFSPAVALDSAGAAHLVSGVPASHPVVTTPGAFQTQPAGSTEGFLLKVVPAIPLAPVNLQAFPLSVAQMRLTWQDRSNNETGFEIQRKGSTGGFVTLVNTGVNATTFIDAAPLTGLLTYRVRAVNEEGESAFTNEAAAAAAPPTVPGSFRAAALGSAAVILGWDDASGESGYRIFRRTASSQSVLLATLPPGSLNFGDIGVAGNQTFLYRVVAFNALGEAASSEVSVAVLRAPTGLDAQPLNLATQLRVVWQDQSGALETGFRVQRRLPGSSFSTVTELPANTTSFTDTGLLPQETYTYRVQALALNSVSSFSNTDSAATARIPVAPSNLRAAALGPDRAALSWTDNSLFEAGFRIERREPSGSFRPVGTVPTDVTDFTDTGLSPRTTYRYRVFAFNDGGDSPASETVEVTTGWPVGGRLRTAPEALRFGLVRQRGAAVRALTLRNASATEELRVTVAVVSGPFALVGAEEVVLAPREQRKLRVRLRLAALGAARGKLVLRSTDAQRPRLAVPLTGWSAGRR